MTLGLTYIGWILTNIGQFGSCWKSRLLHAIMLFETIVLVGGVADLVRWRLAMNVASVNETALAAQRSAFRMGWEAYEEKHQRQLDALAREQEKFREIQGRPANSMPFDLRKGKGHLVSVGGDGNRVE